jgi:hypothetical protein
MSQTGADASGAGHAAMVNDDFFGACQIGDPLLKALTQGEVWGVERGWT